MTSTVSRPRAARWRPGWSRRSPRGPPRRAATAPGAPALSGRVESSTFTGGGDVLLRRTVHAGLGGVGSISAGPMAGSRIQRFPGISYYVVCTAKDPGATLIANDTVKPPRYYRTVSTLSPSAVVAPNQPFRFWNLYSDPSAGPTVAPQQTPPTKSTTTPPTNKKAAKKKPKKKKAEKQTTGEGSGEGVTSIDGDTGGTGTSVVDDTTTDAGALTKSEPEVPLEEEWKGRLRKAAAQQGMQPPAIEKLVQDFDDKLTRYPKLVDTALNDLAAAWRPEFVSGLETRTLQTRQDEFRASMPTFDGNPGTIEDVVKTMDRTVQSAEAAVRLAKKAGTLSTTIGTKCFADLLTEWYLHTAVAHAETVGYERLNVLMTGRGLTAAVLKHYGAETLRDFKGAGTSVWEHLTTAALNSKGDVTGAHDDRVFRNFIRRPNVNYAIIDDPYPEPVVKKSLVPKPTLEGVVPQVATVEPSRAAVYKVRYTEATNTGQPKPDGAVASKTLIRGLTSQQATWMARFDHAIWESIAKKEFNMKGGAFFGHDADGQFYQGFYREGREVDTLFPVLF